MKHFTLPLTVALLLTACNSAPSAPQAEFWERLQTLCGQSFPGEIVSTDEADADWRKEQIIAGPVECKAGEVRMPLAVGEDASRTWIITRDGDTLELRHKHLLKDGSLDPVTAYGGYGAENSSGSRVNFPADQSTKDIFDREGIPVSKANIWAMEVRPDADLFAYEMARPNRFFRIEFDTSGAD